ncbi:MAG: glycosyltransferase family 39 protein [Planctomycetota bacterium]
MSAEDRAHARLVPWLVAITAAGAALRLSHLGIQILGDDEIHLLSVIVSRSPGQIPGTVIGNDFSIPLALFFRAWSDWMPLSEWMLRAPMLLAGCATPALAALVARRYVGPNAAIVVALAVAAHPMFVFYSRYVRPYALCVVLLLVVLWQLDRFRAGARARCLAWAAALTALACWLQPIAVIPVALLYGGVFCAVRLAGPLASERAGDRPRRARHLVVSAFAGLGLALLLYAPALSELVERMILQKVGAGELGTEALLRNARVLAGSAGTVPALLFLAVAIVGALGLARRVGARAVPLLLAAFGTPLAIVALRPSSISDSQVLARYVFYVLPLLLVFAAEALCATAAALRRRSGLSLFGSDTAARTGATLLAALWVGFGSLPTIYDAHTAFAHHNAYQTLEHLRNPLVEAARSRAPDAPVHPYYGQLAEAGPPPPLLLEWPPALEYPSNHYYLAQAFHRLPIKLYAASDEAWLVGPRLALANVITPEELAAGAVPPGTQVLLHRNPIVEQARHMLGRSEWIHPGQWHVRTFGETRERLIGDYGEPVFEDALITAFRVPVRP